MRWQDRTDTAFYSLGFSHFSAWQTKNRYRTETLVLVHFFAWVSLEKSVTKQSCTWKFLWQTSKTKLNSNLYSIILFRQVCVQDFCEELEYWGLDDLHMEPCCQHTYYRARSAMHHTETSEVYWTCPWCSLSAGGSCLRLHLMSRRRTTLATVALPRHRSSSGTFLRIRITPEQQRWASFRWRALINKI